MPEDGTKKSCFIIMPISTPKAYLDAYNGDVDHFKHVLEHLFIPAVETAGFNPISPVSTGSDVIQADIITNLSEADLVLCDMSTLNANVFYEFGIRTALDKPVALVVDKITLKVPFDTGIINHLEYSSDMNVWDQEAQLKSLTEHIKVASTKCNGRNSLWKYFGVSQVGEFNPNASTIEEKIDLLIREVNLSRQSSNSPGSLLRSSKGYVFSKNDIVSFKAKGTNIVEVVFKRIDGSDVAFLISPSQYGYIVNCMKNNSPIDMDYVMDDLL